MHNLVHYLAFTWLTGPAAAGTDGAYTRLTAVDCSKYEAAVVKVRIGTVTATGVLSLIVKNAESTDGLGAAGSTTGGIKTITTVASAGSNTYLWIEVRRPRYKNLYIEYQRTVANIAIHSVEVIRHSPRWTQTNSELDSAYHVWDVLNSPEVAA